MNSFPELLARTRSVRRFAAEAIPHETLEELAGLARLCPSAGNQQALKFKIVDSPDEKERLFGALKWAAALPDWDGPSQGERPAAYIMILCDLALGSNKKIDDGICAHAIMLGASALGYGGCILGAIDRARIAAEFGIDPQKFSIELVLALGRPAEEVRLVDLPADKSINYWRDGDKVHYVPKRPLSEILL